MSSNIPISTGSGAASVATEQIGAVQFQQIKVVDGTASSTNKWQVNSDGSAQVSVVGSLNVSGSVFATLSGAGSIIAIPTGSVIAVLQSSSIFAVPTGNQSVSGTVGASVLGWVPIQASNTSVITVAQGSSIIGIVTGSVVAIPTGNQSISGTVGASVIGWVPIQPSNTSTIGVIQGSVATVIVGGSIAASFTPPANQSVSGAVSISNFPTTQNVSGSVVASGTVDIGNTVTVAQATAANLKAAVSIIGTVPVTQTTSPWVTNFQNSSIVSYQLAGSVLATSATITPSANQSVSGTVGASVIGWIPIQASNTSVISYIQNSVATVIIGGSIAASFTPPANQSVSGAVTVAGSVLLGSSNASVISYLQNSSIIAINAGSVVTVSQGSVITVAQSPSIVGTYAEDAGHTSGDKGLFALGVRNDAVASFVSANLDYTPMAADSAGRTLIRPFAAEEARVEGYASLVSTSVTALVAAAGAGLRNYITDIMVANTGATTTLVTFKDGAGSILGYTIAPTGGGSNMIGFQTPMRTGVNVTFDFQPTVASSILFATVKGFKAP